MLRTGLFAASIGPWLLLASLYNINILVRVRLSPALAPICGIPKTGLPFVKRVPFLNHAGEPDFGNMPEIVFVLATALLVWFTFTYTG